MRWSWICGRTFAAAWRTISGTACCTPPKWPWTPARWPYVWRQGLANLHRPANQTVTVVLSLGFGAFLLTTLYLVQHNLLCWPLTACHLGAIPTLPAIG
jgi:putative ABC transport system permease protein